LDKKKELFEKILRDRYKSIQFATANITPSSYDSLEAYERSTKGSGRVLMVMNDEMARVAISWPEVSKEFDYSNITSVRDDKKQWEILWDCVSYSRKEWIDLCGVSIKVFNRCLKPLVGHKLIFPDGTLNKWLSLWMDWKVISLVNSMRED
tara:strand:+ start:1223 stop:1675 length:453 start_codon:yes stop_codon:yes gene_type:complete